MGVATWAAPAVVVSEVAGEYKKVGQPSRLALREVISRALVAGGELAVAIPKACSPRHLVFRRPDRRSTLGW